MRSHSLPRAALSFHMFSLCIYAVLTGFHWQMTSIFLQYACWAYLPDIAMRLVLSTTHQVLQRLFRIPPPRERTPVYSRHYRYTYAAVVLCYLAYNFVDASMGLPKNFYQLLGVSPGSDEGALKAAFRAFAKKNHPDRIGPGGEALFIDVRDAFEALKDPVVRFAYDRFGPDVLHWQDCTTIKDYLRRGLVSWLLRHVMTFAALFLFSMVGRRSPVAAWRYLLFIGVFAMELCLIVAPSLPPSEARGYTFIDQVTPERMVLESIFPRHVRYQHILFLHQVFLFLSVAVSRVAPALFAGMMQANEEMETGAARALVGRIGELTKGVERELWLMLNGEVQRLDESTMGMVMGEMEDVLVEEELKREGPMKSAWDRAVNKRGVRARSMSL